VLEKQIVVREMRNFKNVDCAQVKSMILNVPWWPISLSEDVDKNFEIYCEIIKIIMNTHIPMRKIRMNTSKPIWMNKEYCELLESVAQSKCKAITSNLEDGWTQYKRLRNKSENWKRKLKLQSFNSFVNHSNNKSKSAWNVFNKEKGTSQSNDTIKSITLNNKKYEKELVVANAFCNYFATSCSKTPILVVNKKHLHQVPL
jgi:hypothetical protein